MQPGNHHGEDLLRCFATFSSAPPLWLCTKQCVIAFSSFCLFPFSSPSPTPAPAPAPPSLPSRPRVHVTSTKIAVHVMQQVPSEPLYLACLVKVHPPWAWSCSGTEKWKILPRKWKWSFFIHGSKRKEFPFFYILCHSKFWLLLSLTQCSLFHLHTMACSEASANYIASTQTLWQEVHT